MSCHDTNKLLFLFIFDQMAERTGLEPATLGVTGRYSNQLNYRSALKTLRRRSLEGVVGAEGIEPPTFAL